MNHLMSREISIPIGHMALGCGQGVLSARSLGSCVAIIIYDRIERAGGMAHCFIASRPNGRQTTAGESPGRYVDTAIPALVQGLLRKGALLSRMQARLVGGSAMFRGIDRRYEIGSRNVDAARTNLAKADVQLAAEDTGGHLSRSAWFDLADGRIHIQYSDKTEVDL